MKVILSLCLSLLAGMLIARTVTFTPDWKKGDMFEVIMETEERRWTNDTLTKEDSYFVDPIMKVLAASKKNLTLQVTFTDIFLDAFSELQETLGYEPAGLELILIYDINREDVTYELTNKESAKKFMAYSMEELRRNEELFQGRREVRNGGCPGRYDEGNLYFGYDHKLLFRYHYRLHARRLLPAHGIRKGRPPGRKGSKPFCPWRHPVGGFYSHTEGIR